MRRIDLCIPFLFFAGIYVLYSCKTPEIKASEHFRPQMNVDKRSTLVPPEGGECVVRLLNYPSWAVTGVYQHFDRERFEKIYSPGSEWNFTVEGVAEGHVDGPALRCKIYPNETHRHRRIAVDMVYPHRGRMHGRIYFVQDPLIPVDSFKVRPVMEVDKPSTMVPPEGGECVVQLLNHPDWAVAGVYQHVDCERFKKIYSPGSEWNFTVEGVAEGRVEGNVLRCKIYPNETHHYRRIAVEMRCPKQGASYGRVYFVQDAIFPYNGNPRHAWFKQHGFKVVE